MTSLNKPIALVTGANKGIGLQIAKDLITHGFLVVVGSRNYENGLSAAADIGDNAYAVQLDVTNLSSVANAAAYIEKEFGRIDVLVQNAGIASTRSVTGGAITDYANTNRPSDASIDEMRIIWETNVFGVLAVYQAMLPLLRRSKQARIVNISSGVGSLTLNANPNYPQRVYFGPGYAASKSALNALTLAMAIELEPEGIKVNAVAPGYIKTSLNGFMGTETVEEGAAQAIRMALLDKDGPTGTFSSAKQGTLPW